MFIRSQAVATVECAQVTYFREDVGSRRFSRLMLPLWGEGRIAMLLGAVEPA